MARIAFLLLVTLATPGCFTPRAVSDLTRPNHVRGVIVQVPGSGDRISVVSEHQHDPGPKFSLEPMFRPIATTTRTEIPLPAGCSPHQLRAQNYAGAIESLQIEHPITVYWRDSKRYPEHPEAGTHCILWVVNDEQEWTNPPKPIVFVRSADLVQEQPVPTERPWLQPKRWGWLAVSPLLDAGVVVLSPFWIWWLLV